MTPTPHHPPYISPEVLTLYAKRRYFSNTFCFEQTQTRKPTNWNWFKICMNTQMYWNVYANGLEWHSFAPINDIDSEHVAYYFELWIKFKIYLE